MMSACNKRKEKFAAIFTAAEQRLCRMLRMRHEADDIAPRIGDAGDVMQGAVWVRGLFRLTRVIDITENDLPVVFQPLQCWLVGHVTPLTMFDGNTERFARAAGRGKSRMGGFDPDPYPRADERERAVAHQHSGQQASLAQNLKPVADTDD